MAFIPAPDRRKSLKEARNESGIALFMVIAAMMVLSILVTEFTYVAQVNQRMAFDGLDQLKAHYLAKSAVKLSLLRLKAYQNVKGLLGGKDGNGKEAGVPGIPKAALDKIWSFPLFYPIPTDIPGVTPGDRERIEAFHKSTGLDGKFSSIVESESAKYNLNLILAPFAPPPSTGTSGPSGPSTPSGPSATSGANPAGVSGPTGFNAEQARKSLADYLDQILKQKYENDPDFAEDHRDFRLEDLLENIYGWADRTYEPRSTGGPELIKHKRAPFYSLSELRMIYPMEDALYDLFAPSLTVSTTPGINVNTMQEHTLRALVPEMSKENGEVDDFFKYRDSLTEDNYFKSAEDFFKYLQKAVGAFHDDPQEIQRYQERLAARNIRIVTDETNFKITVRAQVNQATRLIEAWVTLGTAKNQRSPTTTGASQPAGGSSPPLSGPGFVDPASKPDSGLKVTFMRML